MPSSLKKTKANHATRDHQRPRPALHAIECEQALLSILINHPDVITEMPIGFHHEHFGEPLHAAIFDAIRRLQTAGREVSVYSVLAQLPRPCARVGNISTRQYLASLARDRLNPQDATEYAALIVTAAIRREAVSIAQELADSACENLSVEIILDRARARLACLLPSLGPQRRQIARLWRSGRRWGDEVAKLTTLEMLDLLPEDAIRDPAAIIRAIYEAEGDEGDFDQWAAVTFGLAFGADLTVPELAAFLEGANEAYLEAPIS